MDKFLRLALGGALGWVGLSAYLSGGQNLWVGLSEAPDWGKAGVALAAFQVAPYLPTLAGGGTTFAQVVRGLLLRLVVVGAPAYAAMTGAAAVREGVPDWKIGVSMAGLAAAFMAWRHLVATSTAPKGEDGKELTRAALASHAELRKALTKVARHASLPPVAMARELRVRYVANDGHFYFVDLPPTA